jgi:hypothetical protein
MDSLVLTMKLKWKDFPLIRYCENLIKKEVKPRHLQDNTIPPKKKSKEDQEGLVETRMEIIHILISEIELHKFNLNLSEKSSSMDLKR